MRVLTGNIFDSKCSTIVNAVDCVGVMGKGLALEFRRRYPQMYADYVKRCRAGLVKVGEPYLFDNGGRTKVLNFPTKDHWRNPSELSYVSDGLDWFVANYEKWGVDSIAFPALGCGNGGLAWDAVYPILQEKLCKLPIAVEVYAPAGAGRR